MIIDDVKYRIVFDSRGNETVECEVYAGEVFGRAVAPSGASRGKIEASVVDPYKVKEVEEKVSKALIGMSVLDQEGIDRTLKEIDGTDNFSKIGGNFAIACSIAAARAASELLNIPLYTYLGGTFAKEIPYPLGNVVGGGKHAEGSTSIQEFLVIPVGARSFFEAQKINSEVHKTVKKILKEEGIFAAKGDEGAWAAQISDEKAIEILRKAIEILEKDKGVEIKIGLDFAANELWDGEKYVYKDRKLNREEQINFLLDLVENYNVLYIEDPLHEDDFEGFAEVTREIKRMGAKCFVCGDDLFATRSERIKKGAEIGAANTVLIKPNQVGTLTDTFKAVKVAKERNYEVVVSHRSGESEDNAIAHLSIAFNAKLIKTGIVGGERVAKLNELIRIEEVMGCRMVRL
ncbi:MAG: phosphopyruvate hydratase [Archaeoglobaceae archaeon]|nr:phosphopyruvate hydratase [Archaeoglobaceae archaeon]MCX8151598.1 phosphopyruvate hydratase [Archaeoglobaceae archaeon]MDW8013124.1 phosphopyruvate hydratase [Archaeoglobaceae archaeon]